MDVGRSEPDAVSVHRHAGGYGVFAAPPTRRFSRFLVQSRSHLMEVHCAAAREIAVGGSGTYDADGCDHGLQGLVQNDGSH